MDQKQREEFIFYKKQLETSKNKGANGIVVSVQFLDAILQQNEELQVVQEAYEAIKKVL